MLSLSWYWRVFTILTGGERGISVHLVGSTRKAKSLGLFHTVRCQCIHACNRKERAKGATTKGSCLRQVVPTFASKWICTLLVILLANFPVWRRAPSLGMNLKGLPGITGTWTPTSNWAKKTVYFYCPTGPPECYRGDYHQEVG